MGPQLLGYSKGNFPDRKKPDKACNGFQGGDGIYKCGITMVGSRSLGIQLLDIRWLHWLVSYWNKQTKIGTAFLEIEVILDDIYSNLMMDLLLITVSGRLILLRCEPPEAVRQQACLRALVISHSSDRMPDSSTVFSTVLWDKD